MVLLMIYIVNDKDIIISSRADKINHRKKNKLKNVRHEKQITIISIIFYCFLRVF